MYGKIAYFPLRWSEAFFSTNSFISQWTLNPILNLYHTSRFNEPVPDKEFIKKNISLLEDFLDYKFDKPLQLKRSISNPPNSDRPNIVLILLESLAANKLMLYKNHFNATPAYNKLAKSSYIFKNFFTPTYATARGVWTTLTGIPDVALRKSSSRNPIYANQDIIVDQLAGYEKYYFLGGSANWANIRGLFTNNIKGVKVIEEGDFTSPRVDIWGISDLDLFKEAHKVLNKIDKPFFAFIQTAGFHRPYTIPKQKDDFKIVKDIAKEKLNEQGFLSLKEYNSLRFLDYSLGRYLELLENSKYKDNTIFAMLGDHGLNTEKSLNMPPGYTKHKLTVNQTPFLIYYPSKLKPAINEETIGSQVDVLPTIAELAGLNWQASSLGRSLFKQRSAENNFAFLFSPYPRPYRLGLIGKENLYLYKNQKKHLYKYNDLNNFEINYNQQERQVTEKMHNLSKMLYESTLFIRSN